MASAQIAQTLDLTKRMNDLGPIQGVAPKSARRSTDKALPQQEDRQAYSRIGRNTALEAKPAIVHFGGYTPMQAHTQKVRVINISNASTRLTILNPQTRFFQVNCTKRGLVAPGMAEELEVVFTPTEWRYYYDSIRIQCAGQNILIPLHGYPVMNNAVFPRKIDMGSCQLGQSVTQGVKLECKVPIEFEYEITPMDHSPEFTVSPMKGIIPANGGLEVQITYTPKRMATSSTQLRVNISQFGFEPLVARVVASACPAGNPRSKGQAEGAPWAQPSRPMSAGPGRGFTDPKYGEGNEEIRAKAAQPQRPKSSRGSRGSRKKRRRSNKKSKAQKSEQSKENNTADRRIQGVMVPDKPTSHSAVAYMLNQQPGKLTLQELQGAISINQSEQEAQQKELHSATSPRSALKGATHHPQDYSYEADVDQNFLGQNRQMKEMIHLRALSEYDKHEKTLVINPSKQRIGQKIMGAFKRDELEKEREANKARIAWAEREVERNNPSNTDIKIATRSQYVEGEHRVENFQIEDVKFNLFANDDWAMKQRTLETFIRLVSKLIIRQRCDQRCQAIRDVLRENSTATEAAALTDFSLTGEEIGRANWLAVQSDTPPDRKAVELEDAFPEFCLTNPITLQIPYEFKLFEYQQHVPEVVPAVPRKDSKPLVRAGALDEQAKRGPTGDVTEFVGKKATASDDEQPGNQEVAKRTPTPPTKAKPTKASVTTATLDVVAALETTHAPVPAMPKHTVSPYPVQPLELMRSAPELAVYSQPLEAETSPHYAFLPIPLQTTSLPYFLAEEVGSECSHSLLNLPTISDLCAPRVEPILDYAFTLGGSFPDLVMEGLPALLDGLDFEDAANLVDDEMDPNLAFSAPQPSMELARSLFSVDETTEEVAVQEEKNAKGAKAPAKEKKSARGKQADNVEVMEGPVRLPVSNYDGKAAKSRLLVQLEDDRRKVTRRLTDGVRNLTTREEQFYVPPLVWPFDVHNHNQKSS